MSPLTTVVSYPERGPFGDHKFRGNCSGYLVKDLVEYFEPKTLLDPMEGGGTSREVCEALGVEYEGHDLAQGDDHDVFEKPWGDRRFDLVFWHPPYASMIKYSDNPLDLSGLTVPEFREALIAVADLLFREAVVDGGRLAVLIGTMRKNGRIFAFARDLITDWREPTEPEIVKVQHHVTSKSTRAAQLFGNRFIPIVDERVLVWRKPCP